jgi:hypothetical protein
LAGSLSHSIDTSFGLHKRYFDFFSDGFGLASDFEGTFPVVTGIGFVFLQVPSLHDVGKRLCAHLETGDSAGNQKHEKRNEHQCERAHTDTDRL